MKKPTSKKTQLNSIITIQLINPLIRVGFEATRHDASCKSSKIINNQLVMVMCLQTTVTFHTHVCDSQQDQSSDLGNDFKFGNVARNFLVSKIKITKFINNSRLVVLVFLQLEWRENWSCLRNLNHRLYDTPGAMCFRIQTKLFGSETLVWLCFPEYAFLWVYMKSSPHINEIAANWNKNKPFCPTVAW